MELRQLEYFIAVAEEANFTRAAERVHISQSGVSAQVRQLERDLGATLIDRSGRTATLTAAGAAALEPARTALAADNSDRLIEGVRSGATDLALIGAAGSGPAGLEVLPIVSERLVAGVPDG